jgi:RNA polymerase sigma-70 factor (ECF subfamily)
LAGERRRVLLAAVNALSEPDRLVVSCRYFLDLSEAETAEVLGWPKGSVKSRLSRALVRLRVAAGPITEPATAEPTAAAVEAGLG